MNGLIPGTPAATLADAYLEVAIPEQPNAKRRIPFRFNPSEYSLKKTQTLAEIGIPGLASPILQWIRGGAETLTFDALLDTSDSLENVDDKFVKALRVLLDPDMQLHAPPVVDFVWGPRNFRGVLDSLSISYTLFSAEGTPLRAKASISLREYRPAEVQERAHQRSSPDVEKTYLVRRGDTLPNIAAALFRDPARWRELAEANGIRDTRRVLPGTRLRVPRLA